MSTYSMHDYQTQKADSVSIYQPFEYPWRFVFFHVYLSSDIKIYDTVVKNVYFHLILLPFFDQVFFLFLRHIFLFPITVKVAI